MSIVEDFKSRLDYLFSNRPDVRLYHNRHWLLPSGVGRSWMRKSVNVKMKCDEGKKNKQDRVAAFTPDRR